MFNIHNVVEALVDQLNSDIDVYNIAKAKGGEYINNDVNQAPWIGVYRGSVEYSPRALGYNNWEVAHSIRVVAQEKSLITGSDCEQKLEDLVQKIITAVSSDKTIGNTVDMCNSIGVEYGFIETDRSSVYFQSAVITINLEVAVS